MIVAICETADFENFLPLTYTRPSFELRCGIHTLRERLSAALPSEKTILFAREYLAPTEKKRAPECPVNDPVAIDDVTLFVNGTLIVDSTIQEILRKNAGRNILGLRKGKFIFARLTEKSVPKEILSKPIDGEFIRKARKVAEIIQLQEADLIEYPWQLIDKNGALISEDYHAMHDSSSEPSLDSGAVVYGKSTEVHLGRGTFVETGVILDVRGGPVYIDDNVYVQAPSRITGPCYIGKDSTVFGAQIREGCTIGPVCRIGGEVEQTIFHGYSNKRHTGFIGHSYVGEWVNCGSGTQNSDLKNTYGSVKVSVKGKRLDTGRTFVGCFMGDHVKTSIGAQIFTGTKIGVCSHALGFVDEDVPSFTMWGRNIGMKPVEIYLKSALETAKRVISRRKVEQTKDDIKLLTTVFKLTARERRNSKVSKQKLK